MIDDISDSGEEPANLYIAVEEPISLESDLGNGKIAIPFSTSGNSHNLGQTLNLKLKTPRTFPTRYGYKKATANGFIKNKSGGRLDIVEDYQQSGALDENFWNRAMKEKEEQLRRVRLIKHHQGLLEQQRYRLLELKKSIDRESENIKVQKESYIQLSAIVISFYIPKSSFFVE